jgi:hypothetical protein
MVTNTLTVLENAKNNKTVMANARKFANEVRADKHVVKALLFGPHADGTAIDGESSEINVCFIFKDYGGMTLTGITGELALKAWRCGLPADIYPFKEDSLREGNEFLEDILKKGMVI